VLNLLEILPINLEVKLYIKDNILKMSSTQLNLNDWYKIFSWNALELSKPCYFLMGLEELMIPRRDLINQEAM